MSAPDLMPLVEITSTRLVGVVATLRELAETPAVTGNARPALHLLADCVELSAHEIDEAVDP